jgi:hypothetical protein
LKTQHFFLKVGTGVLLLVLIAAMQNCSGLSSNTSTSSNSSTAGGQGSTPPQLAVTSQAQIQISNSIVATVGADFIGFSYEKSILSNPLFSSSNAPLVALFTKWGPGVLRVGGNSVNKTIWNAQGEGMTSGQTAPADVDRLAGFLRATGWKVIYGLNDTTSSATLSASEAAYAATSLGQQLQDFEIGNEPDLYHSNGLEPSTFTLADFENNWRTYSQAIAAQVPAALFSGPAAATSYSSFTIPFASVEGSHIEYLTQHYYRANGQLSTSTLDFLLTPDNALSTEVAALSAAAKSAKILKGFRMAETNSFYNGGAPGVSDGFGTALWLIEYCFTLAQNGAVGANFHGGGDSTGYTPIANDTHGNVVQARAEYYGMLLFSMMGPGTVLQTKVTGQAAALYAYTVKNSAGKIAVVILNNSRTDIVGATITFPSSIANLEALLLTAPSLDVTTGMTFGGSTIGADGSWSAATTYNLSADSGSLNIDVPPGSAYLILSQ